MAKYHLDDPGRHRELARQSCQKADELDPESPLLNHLYTYYQLEELGDGRGARQKRHLNITVLRWS